MKRNSAGFVVLGIVSLLAAVALVTALPESSRRYLNAEGRGDDLPFSHVVDTGDTVYLAGGIGIDPSTGRAPADIGQEIRLLMDGMKAKLALAGLTLDDLVSVSVYCTDLSRYDEFNAIYRTYFKTNYPVRAFVGSGPLLRGGHFEITGIARRR